MQEIKPLTDEEIQTLQVDSALRKIGEIDKYLYEINIKISEAMNTAGQANLELEILKSQKSLLVERARNLKVFVKNVPD